MPKDRLSLHIYESALLFIVLVSVSSILLLVSHCFSSINAVLLGSILFVGLSIIFKFGFTFSDKRFDGVVLLILLIAFFFRSGPYLWIMGGQDQGVYVNMSAFYERVGSTFIKDDVRANLADQKVKDYYDAHNHLSIGDVKKGQYEGAHSPGIYIESLQDSSYVFQFYPLHPIWMSIFGKFFGSENRVYSLVFFSLISIVAFYLLGLELSGGKKLVGYLAAGFLAVNSLHAYLSKFPVSEVVFLAFSASAFYFLIRYYKALKHHVLYENKDSLEERVTPFYLFLSAGLMACLFFTRISGFMYIPLFYLLLLAIVLFVQQNVVKKQLILYVLAVFGLYAVSVLYGLVYSFPYSRDIYCWSFTPILGSDWEVKLGLFAAFAALFLAGTLFAQKRKLGYLLRRITIFFRNNLHLILYAIISLAAYRAYQLGFTDKYVDVVDPWIGVRWQMANLGWKSILFSNLFVAVLYLSPFAALLTLFAINYLRKKKDILIDSLFVFLAAFGFYTLVVRVITPRGYFFVRILLSELLPYSLLLASLYLGYLISKTRLSKIIACSLIGLTFAYSLFFVSSQLLGREADGADAALKRVQTQMDKGDLLLLFKRDLLLYHQIKTPLSYYYGLEVFDFEDIEDMSGVLRNVVLDYEDVFVLSQFPVNCRFLVPADEISYREGHFQPDRSSIPTKFSYVGVELFLYKVDKSVFVGSHH